MRLTRLFFLSLAAVLGAASGARAHFLFLVPQADDAGRTTVQVYFSEDASPDDPELLQRITDLKAWRLRGGDDPQPLSVERTSDALLLKAGDNAADALIIARDDYGVISRGGKPFRLHYYAKTGPAVNHPVWKQADASPQLKLDVVPSYREGRLHVQVRFNGQPVAGAQVVVSGGNLADELTTDSKGSASIDAPKADVYSIRARHIEAVGGKLDDLEYAETRHYSTVAVEVKRSAAPAADGELARLEKPVTSFGAATLGGDLYVYGGHAGGAHSYSRGEQGDTLLKLSLSGKDGWRSLAKGPPLQGLAMVAHGGKLYRLGGFTAKNDAGEEHDLWSQDDVACFDPATGAWTEMPSLPEPRSSFDAAVLGDAVYVVGGWQLRGDEDSIWHSTAWKLDLSKPGAAWEPVPSPPFHRRALALAAFRGKLYAIGGMQQEGGPTKSVSVFDPATGAWSDGPAILGEKGMAGFGASAFALGDALYVGTSEGKLQRLRGDAWEIARDLPTPRFFHRMLPASADRFVIVGGANMGIGKFDTVELITAEGKGSSPAGASE